MIISISFGLIFGTFIVLFLLPAFLVGTESLRARFAHVQSDFSRRLRSRQPAAAVATGTRASMTTEDPMSRSKWSKE